MHEEETVRQWRAQKASPVGALLVLLWLWLTAIFICANPYNEFLDVIGRPLKE